MLEVNNDETNTLAVHFVCVCVFDNSMIVYNRVSIGPESTLFCVMHKSTHIKTQTEAKCYFIENNQRISNFHFYNGLLTTYTRYSYHGYQINNNV